MGSVTEAVKGAQVSAGTRTYVSVLDPKSIALSTVMPRLRCRQRSEFHLPSQIELAALTGPRAKAIRLLRLTRIFAAELLGSLIIIPYGDPSCHPCVQRNTK